MIGDRSVTSPGELAAGRASMRELNPFLAFLASILGLGFPYVGEARPRSASDSCTIEIRDGRLIRNGQGIAEPYVHAPLHGRPCGRDVSPVRLRISEYYVLGDFRDLPMTRGRSKPRFQGELDE